MFSPRRPDNLANSARASHALSRQRQTGREKLLLKVYPAIRLHPYTRIAEYTYWPPQSTRPSLAEALHQPYRSQRLGKHRMYVDAVHGRAPLLILQAHAAVPTLGQRERRL